VTLFVSEHQADHNETAECRIVSPASRADIRPRTTPARLFRIVGTNVRLGRERMGLTQEDLAAVAEIDLSYLSRMERGKANPSVEVLGKLAKALGTTPAALLTEAVGR